MMRDYFAPTQLAVTPTKIERVLLLGNCIFDKWVDAIAAAHPGASINHIIYDYAETATAGDQPYDLRLVQMPLRLVYPEFVTMQTRYADEAAYQEALGRAFHRMRAFLAMVNGGSPDRPTFFLNYYFPQGAAMGRLFPRYDLRNPTFFIQRVNRGLHDIVAGYPGAHVLDIEQVAATFGRRFVQDDAFWSFSHGGLMNDYDWYTDGERLEPEEPVSARHELRTEEFVEAVWKEAIAMLRTIRGTDRVKMICVDLDDTLWRGVLAELDEIDYTRVEGWPIGFAEALLLCRNRGIILAVISKNDERNVVEIIDRAFAGRITLDDFAIRKINWSSKPQNVAEAIAEANVLPESVVYIDDNPVERAAVKAMLPGVRMLGAPHLEWRRILLWSAETQVPAISAESSRRTEMIQAQVAREQDRESLSHADFLADLDVRIALDQVASSDAPHFARAFELVNKTNQFNTTGRRWTHEEADAHFAGGGRWWVFSVRDRYTFYGLVGVLIERAGHIDQFVMSCRVFGLQIERAVLAGLQAHTALTGGTLVETPKNGPCRQVYAEAGWRGEDDEWIPQARAAIPTHIRFVEML